MSSVEQHQGHAEPGKCLDQGVEPGSGLDQGGGRPAEAIGDLGQKGDLVGFGGKRLDNPGAVDVLVDHHGHLGHSSLGYPREGEYLVAKPLAEDVHEGHGGHGHQSQRNVDAEHEAQRHEETDHRQPGQRSEGQEQLDGPDVGIGPRDDLAGRHPVVERERQPGQVSIEQGTEVGFDPAGRSEEQVPVGEAQAKRGQGHDHEQDHVGL